MGLIDINIKPSTLGFVVVGIIFVLLLVGNLINRLDDWLSLTPTHSVGDTYIAIGLIMVFIIFIIFLFYIWKGRQSDW